MAALLSSLRRGGQLALPVTLGYLPVGFAFGILAVQGGMTPLTAGLMSFFVYAGSAQLIAAGMLINGMDLVSIIAATFIVNLRHLLMSAALAPYLRKWPKLFQAWFCFEMTDETFAVNLGRFSSSGVFMGESLACNGIAHMSWVTGGVAGALFGDLIGDVKPWGLDFALPGMFIALLLPYVRLPRRAFAAALGAVFSLTLAVCGAGQWNVMLGTVAAATVAAFIPVRAWERPGRASSCEDKGEGE